MICDPEERPTAIFVLHLRRCLGRSAGVSRTGAVRSAVIAIVLVVCDEHRERLGGRGACVVAAFRCLDGGGDCGWGAGGIG